MQNKRKAKKKATYLECKWKTSLAEKMKPEKPRGEEEKKTECFFAEERREEKSFFAEERRQNASERGIKFFMFLNEGQN